MKNYILFDHDGVLVDTEAWYFKAGERALADIGLRLDKDQYLRDMSQGLGTWAQVRAAGLGGVVRVGAGAVGAGPVEAGSDGTRSDGGHRVLIRSRPRDVTPVPEGNRTPRKAHGHRPLRACVPVTYTLASAIPIPASIPVRQLAPLFH